MMDDDELTWKRIREEGEALIADLKKGLDGLEAQMTAEELRQYNRELNEENAKLRGDIKDLEAEIEVLKDKIDGLRMQISWSWWTRG